MVAVPRVPAVALVAAGPGAVLGVPVLVVPVLVLGPPILVALVALVALVIGGVHAVVCLAHRDHVLPGVVRPRGPR